MIFLHTGRWTGPHETWYIYNVKKLSVIRQLFWLSFPCFAGSERKNNSSNFKSTFHIRNAIEIPFRKKIREIDSEHFSSFCGKCFYIYQILLWALHSFMFSHRFKMTSFLLLNLPTLAEFLIMQNICIFLASGVQRAMYVCYKQTADKEKNVYKNSRTLS